MKDKKVKSFEEQFLRLKEIVELLESGNGPLDELLSLYEEGMSSAKSLREYLNKAEQKVIDISKKAIE
jgi:exodeoxyribonuclease VII small subunit